MKNRNVANERNCPECGVSWVGAVIPPDQRKEYGNKANFSRLIHCYDWKTKVTTGYECPDCFENFPLSRKWK